MKGQVINSWTVIRPERDEKRRILCRCECGKVIEVDYWNVAYGLSKGCTECGLARTRKAVTTHGESDSTGNTRLYRIWKAMKWRCSPKNWRSRPCYFDRGIRVCQEWQSDYFAFRAWATSHGYAPELTIDRIDNYGNYDPENCRWASYSQQARNTRRSRFLSAFGETKTIPEWAEDSRCVVSYSNLRGRLDRGWDCLAALTTPKLRTGGIRQAA